LRKIVGFVVLNDIDQAKNFLYQVVFQIIALPSFYRKLLYANSTTVFFCCELDHLGGERVVGRAAPHHGSIQNQRQRLGSV
jgi:hypothetical protein